MVLGKYYELRTGKGVKEFSEGKKLWCELEVRGIH
jgi:hypothetical protein